MKVRGGWIALIACVVALAVPATSSAWHYVFNDFFGMQGSGIGAARATAKKCGPGGKLGAYDYRSSVGAYGESFELEFEILSKLSVRNAWGKMRRVEVAYTATNYPEDLAEQAAVALDEFHQTVFTKFKDGKHPKLLVRHGELVMFGNVVVESDEVKTKFDPKPGC